MPRRKSLRGRGRGRGMGRGRRSSVSESGVSEVSQEDVEMTPPAEPRLTLKLTYPVGKSVFCRPQEKKEGEGEGGNEESPPVSPSKGSELVQTSYEQIVEELEPEMVEFFQQVFIWIVKRKKLLPEVYFDERPHPLFGRSCDLLQERGDEYIEEISKSLVFFMLKGVLEGVVLHVKVNKKVVQGQGRRRRVAIIEERYVIKFRYGPREQKVDVSDSKKAFIFREAIRNQMKECFRQLTGCEMEPCSNPFDSRWSISTAFQPEFIRLMKMAGHDEVDGPYIEDPARDHFPWRKKPRFSQALKMGLIDVQKMSDEKWKSYVVQKRLRTLKRKVEAGELNPNPSPSPTPSPSAVGEGLEGKLPKWEYLTSSSSEAEEGEEGPPKAPKMQVLAEANLLPGIVFFIYRLKYGKVVPPPPVIETDSDMFETVQK